MRTVTMIPAIDNPIDALPSLLAPAGSDTAVLHATTVHTLSTYHTWRCYTVLLNCHFRRIWPEDACFVDNDAHSTHSHVRGLDTVPV